MSAAGDGPLFEERQVPRRRRRPLVALLVVVVVLVLLAVIAVIADNAVRAYAEDRVRTELRTALSLPDDAPLDVRIGGFSMLLQLVSGTIDRVDVAADSVDFGGLTGPATVVATGVPLDQTQPVEALRLRFGATEHSLTTLSANLSGLPITSVAIDGDEIDVSGELQALFITLPLGVGLIPAADDGQIAFTPTSIRVADAVFTADDLRDRFGSLADQALETRDFCISEYLPAPITLTDVTLDDPRMVLTFDAADVVLDEATLDTMGTCP